MLTHGELAAQPAGGVVVARDRDFGIVARVKIERIVEQHPPGDHPAALTDRHLEARERIGEIRIADALVQIVEHQADRAGAHGGQPFDVPPIEPSAGHRRGIQRRQAEDPGVIAARVARHDVERAGEPVAETHRQHAAVEIEAADHRRIEHT